MDHTGWSLPLPEKSNDSPENKPEMNVSASEFVRKTSSSIAETLKILPSYLSNPTLQQQSNGSEGSKFKDNSDPTKGPTNSNSGSTKLLSVIGSSQKDPLPAKTLELREYCDTSGVSYACEFHQVNLQWAAAIKFNGASKLFRSAGAFDTCDEAEASAAGVALNVLKHTSYSDIDKAGSDTDNDMPNGSFSGDPMDIAENDAQNDLMLVNDERRRLIAGDDTPSKHQSYSKRGNTGNVSSSHHSNAEEPSSARSPNHHRGRSDSVSRHDRDREDRFHNPLDRDTRNTELFWYYNSKENQVFSKDHPLSALQSYAWHKGTMFTLYVRKLEDGFFTGSIKFVDSKYIYRSGIVRSAEEVAYVAGLDAVKKLGVHFNPPTERRKGDWIIDRGFFNNRERDERNVRNMSDKGTGSTWASPNRNMNQKQSGDWKDRSRDLRHEINNNHQEIDKYHPSVRKRPSSPTNDADYKRTRGRSPFRTNSSDNKRAKSRESASPSFRGKKKWTREESPSKFQRRKSKNYRDRSKSPKDDRRNRSKHRTPEPSAPPTPKGWSNDHSSSRRSEKHDMDVDQHTPKKPAEKEESKNDTTRFLESVFDGVGEKTENGPAVAVEMPPPIGIPLPPLDMNQITAAFPLLFPPAAVAASTQPSLGVMPAGPITLQYESIPWFPPPPDKQQFPLHYAAITGDFEAMKAILSSSTGANQNIRSQDTFGRMPLHCLCQSINPTARSAEWVDEAVMLLIGWKRDDEEALMQASEILECLDGQNLTPLATTLLIDARIARRKRERISKMFGSQKKIEQGGASLNGHAGNKNVMETPPASTYPTRTSSPTPSGEDLSVPEYVVNEASGEKEPRVALSFLTQALELFGTDLTSVAHGSKRNVMHGLAVCAVNMVERAVTEYQQQQTAQPQQQSGGESQNQVNVVDGVVDTIKDIPYAYALWSQHGGLDIETKDRMRIGPIDILVKELEKLRDDGGVQAEGAVSGIEVLRRSLVGVIDAIRKLKK